jgi:hypothetical protein
LYFLNYFEVLWQAFDEITFKEICVVFYKTNNIKTLLIKDAAMNTECKFLRPEERDNAMFVWIDN